MDKAKYQNQRIRWLAERKISPRWWRCTKCLRRCYVATIGWVCTGCKIRCEEDRQHAREKLPPDEHTRTDDTSAFSASNAVIFAFNFAQLEILKDFCLQMFQLCSKCNGSALRKGDDGAWAICTKCQGDAYETKPIY